MYFINGFVGSYSIAIGNRKYVCPTQRIFVDQFQLENNRKYLMEMLNEALKKSLRNTNWYISSENARTLFQLLNVIAVAMHFHMIV